jgi:hypothetical protein
VSEPIVFAMAEPSPPTIGSAAPAGTTLVIGAPWDNRPGAADSGSAHVLTI